MSMLNENEIASLRKGSKILLSVMNALEGEISIGENTAKIDELAEELILKAGGRPAFKNYGAENGKPFPATICASLNDEVVHGIPSEKVILKNGDLLKIDVGMEYQGVFSDMARTFAVGEISYTVRKLMEVTEQSFWEGIKNLKSGSLLSDYSKAVQRFVEKNGFSVVRNLVGHGIGKKLHEDPQIPNYYDRRYYDVKLKEGTALALEPMVNQGDFRTKLQKDGWTFRTRDGKPSAHYENTVLVTAKRVEVLTYDY